MVHGVVRAMCCGISIVHGIRSAISVGRLAHGIPCAMYREHSGAHGFLWENKSYRSYRSCLLCHEPLNLQCTWLSECQRPVRTSPFASVQVRFTLPPPCALRYVLRRPPSLWIAAGLTCSGILRFKGGCFRRKFDFSCQVLYIKYSMSKMEFIFK